MLSRRQWLLAAAGLLLGQGAQAGPALQRTLGWRSFISGMRGLAQRHAAGALEAEAIGTAGLGLMQAFDPLDPDFLAAVAGAWESGNDFWLWQRLTREAGLNGGILNIERGHDVPLHDHPGATGVLRILTGEAEVWQFDRAAAGDDRAELQLVTRRVLRPGDTAVLLPGRGNIHGLRAVSEECRMLDYFIPPYRRAERAWYVPLTAGWADQAHISCRVVSDHAFGLS